MINDKENKSICVLPWVHQVIGTYGETRMCCFMGNGHGNVDDFDDAWNGDYMRDVRGKMLKGEQLPECHLCYNKEEIGQRSARQNYNANWLNRDDIARRIERSAEANMVVDEEPIFIEIRFGNLCNLMCKMCNGSFSSQILKDAERLKKIDPDGYDEFMEMGDHRKGRNYTWYEMDSAWEHIDKFIPHLEEIHIAGGEPTMIRQNIDFLQRCIDLGHADRIRVHFVTNATNINNEFIGIIKSFRTFGLTLSIDAIEEGYEYIRYPGDWSSVRVNVVRLLEETEANICFNFLVQAYNVLDLPKIFDEFLLLYLKHGHFDEEYSRVQITCITYPQRFAIQQLPQNVKDLALQRLMNWKDSHFDNERLLNKFSPGGLTMIEAQLRQPTEGNPKALLDYSRFQDQNKKATLPDNLPELHRMLQEAVET